MLDAGSVVAVLGGRFNPRGFEAFNVAMNGSLRSATAFEAGLARSTSRSEAALGRLGKAAKVTAGAGFLALGAGIAVSIKQAAQFERAMRNVNSIAGLNERQFKSLNKQVLDLSATTAQAPKTLAEGLYQLVSSGFSANQSIKILHASAKAASAGLTDTATATTAVAGALNAYHLPASAASKVSDQLFQTVNRGVITFEQLAQSIGTVLPYASSMHVGLNQVGAALSTLTKEGIPPAEAVTRLERALVSFIKPSKEMAAAVKETGAASAESLVQQKGLEGAIKAVIATTNGSKNSIHGLFPDIRALGGALALTGKNASTAEGDLRAFNDATVKGATAKVFAEQAKSASFQFQQLKANLSALAITVGTVLLPAINQGVRSVSAFARELLTGKGAGGDFVRDVTAGFKTMSRDISAAVHAIEPVIRAVGPVARAAFGTALAVGRAMEEGFRGIVQVISGILHGNLAAAFNGVKTVISGSVHAITGLLAGLAGVAVSVASVVGGAIRGTLGGAFSAVARVIRGAISSILGLFSSLLSGAASVIHGLSGIPLLGGAFKGMANQVNAAAASVNHLRDQLNGIPTHKQINIDVITRTFGKNIPPNKKASGRGPGGTERALVGEGGGPEWIVNPASGTAWRTPGPMVTTLGPSDYVIPTETKYRGRALGLLRDLARDIGATAYAKGRTPKPPKPVPGLNPFNNKREIHTPARWREIRIRYQQQRKNRLGIDVTSPLASSVPGLDDAKDISDVSFTGDIPLLDSSNFMLPDEQGLFDKLDMAAALADLTDPLADDITAAENLSSFFDQIVRNRQAQHAPAPVIAAAARAAKQAHDQVKSLTQPGAAPGPTADQQAINDQQFTRGFTAGRGAFLDAGAGRVMAGSGDIGGGRNVNVTIQSLHPGTPAVMAEVARSVTTGLSYQQQRQSKRVVSPL